MRATTSASTVTLLLTVGLLLLAAAPDATFAADRTVIAEQFTAFG